MLKIKNISKQAVSSIIALTLVTTPVYGSVSFNDVKEGNWYKENVQKIADEGLINGYPDGSFKPNNTIRVGEFLSICVNMIKSKDEKLRSLEQNEYWAVPVYEYLVESGIIKYSDQFGPRLLQPINREDMAYIIVKMVEKKEGTLKILDKIENNINDIEKISGNRKEAVLKAYSNGILTGKGINFDPKGSTTRAEAATVATRMLWDEYRVDVVANEKPVEINKSIQEQALQLINETENNINAVNAMKKTWKYSEAEYKQDFAFDNNKKLICEEALNAYLSGATYDWFTEEDLGETIEYEKFFIEHLAISLFSYDTILKEIKGQENICTTTNISRMLSGEKNKVNSYKTKDDLKVLEDLKEKSEVALYFAKNCCDVLNFASYEEMVVDKDMKKYYPEYSYSVPD